MTVEPLNCFEEYDIDNSKLPEEWQSQKSLDELSEFLQQNWEQRSVFFDDSEVTSRQQFLKFTSHKGIRTNNYVGSIAFKGRQMNIFPKVFREDRYDGDTNRLNLNHLMENLAQWVQYCNKINYPFLNITSTLKSTDNLRELFVTLYLHYVKQALDRGAFYRYEDRVEDLNVIKGHIDFKDYINHKIPNGLSNKFQCSFSEFEFDNIVNRIIKHTCKLIVNLTDNRENKKIIRNILTRMNEVRDVSCKPSDCDGVKLSKIHRHYSVILSMSKMFLLNKTNTYTIDTNESFCFLFPTELLFEGFIGGFMKEMLEDEAKVRFQVGQRKLISNISVNGVSHGDLFKMKLDILVEHKNKKLFILDTKYKLMERIEGNDNIMATIGRDLEQGDLYQVINYALQYDQDDVYLLYPMYRFEDLDRHHVVMDSVSVSGKTIKIHVIRLPFVFESDIEKTKMMLATSISKIFE